MTRTYSLVTESGPSALSAYVPELPSILVTGTSADESGVRAVEAIRIYWELGMHLTQVTTTGSFLAGSNLEGSAIWAYVVGPVSRVCCTRRKKSFPRLLDFLLLKRNVNSSR